MVQPFEPGQKSDRVDLLSHDNPTDGLTGRAVVDPIHPDVHPRGVDEDSEGERLQRQASDRTLLDQMRVIILPDVVDVRIGHHLIASGTDAPMR